MKRRSKKMKKLKGERRKIQAQLRAANETAEE